MASLSKGLQGPATSTDSDVRQDVFFPKEECSQRFPLHPMHQLQGPFEESIRDALEYMKNEWIVDLDAQSRRRDLLESSEYVRLCGRKWKQKEGERYHPFWKLTAQISFGVNLLVKGLAKSDTEVLKLLQCHVDEVDGFLGRTTEDFLIIQIDVRTRIQYLSLPLENLNVFDEMLEDHSFRRAMIEYNEQIEHAVSRFSMAVQDTLKDIQKGREATGTLWQYLRQSARDNSPVSGNLSAIYNAMIANTEGWNVAFSKLQRKGMSLQSILCQLGLAITEMQRRVGIASRKGLIPHLHVLSTCSQGKSLRERVFDRKLPTRDLRSSIIPDKPLPHDPSPADSNYITPSPGKVERRLMSQKSAPNLRASNPLQARTEKTNNPNAPKQLQLNSAAYGSNPKSLLLKIHKNLGKRLSKASLTMKKPTVGDRPSTAPSRIFKSQSASLEQLKSSRGVQEEQSLGISTLPPPDPLRSQASQRHDGMKTQLSQYFKSDQVTDAWETTAQQNTLVRRLSRRTKDEPWSKFRAKSPNILDNSGDVQTKLFEEDLERQMTWLQEGTEALNTYSLRPRRDVAPCIHVLSVYMTLAQEPGEREEREEREKSVHNNIESTDVDTQSIITALPAMKQ